MATLFMAHRHTFGRLFWRSTSPFCGSSSDPIRQSLTVFVAYPGQRKYQFTFEHFFSIKASDFWTLLPSRAHGRHLATGNRFSTAGPQLYVSFSASSRKLPRAVPPAARDQAGYNRFRSRTKVRPEFLRRRQHAAVVAAPAATFKVDATMLPGAISVRIYRQPVRPAMPS